MAQPLTRVAASRRHTPPPEFGPVLRAARLRQAWSVRQAAREIGVSYGYVANLEAGRYSPSTSTAGRLVKVLGLVGDDAAIVLAAGIPDAGRDSPWQQTRDRGRRMSRVG